MSGVGTAIAIGAGVSAAGALGGAAISSNAAGKAASTQASAAEQGQQLQAKEAADALAFQKEQWTTQQANLAPWLSAGKGALSNLTGLLSTPGAGLLTPWSSTFTAPTDVTEQNDPGYKFRLAQGEGALENSAAAGGSLLSGNTLEAQQKFGQNFASNEYSNVYNRAMQEYAQKYGIFENNQTNLFNRLAAVSGVGQTAATTLGQEGQAAANNVGNIDLTTGAQQGQQLNNAAAATASGYIGGANAWGGALGGSTNSLMNFMLMNQIFGNGATTPNMPSANPPVMLAG
ncbi:MAG TPA: hypothetical protein VFF58_00690 [Candidatus Nitrosotalea sp.]|nr:hypothetical protein [Candidatus Nitrosotalea sp.]